MGSSQVALVTGASRGIGRAVAVRLAGLGYRAVAVARGREALAETVAACRAAGGEAEARPCDLTSGDAAAALIGGIDTDFGRLDILVHNAGAFHRGPLATTDAETQRHLLDLNVASPLFLAGRATPLLAATAAAHGRAAHIFVASLAGLQGFADEAIYAASKHAVVGLGRSLFPELREKGVAVTTICPGLVATDMAAGRGAHLGRALAAEDVADAVAYAASCRASACPTEITLQPLRDPWVSGG